MAAPGSRLPVRHYAGPVSAFIGGARGRAAIPRYTRPTVGRVTENQVIHINFPKYINRLSPENFRPTVFFSCRNRNDLQLFPCRKGSSEPERFAKVRRDRSGWRQVFGVVFIRKQCAGCGQAESVPRNHGKAVSQGPEQAAKGFWIRKGLRTWRGGDGPSGPEQTGPKPPWGNGPGRRQDVSLAGTMLETASEHLTPFSFSRTVSVPLRPQTVPTHPHTISSGVLLITFNDLCIRLYRPSNVPPGGTAWGRAPLSQPDAGFASFPGM